ncbi:MAG: RsmD family RNA methyltransferase [Planctomycetota bacterium]|jgi:16S rRNA (guanine966-N2)-methyltransferase|nr:RsmD family RNA methyltransferase [Planctomycetota bacterium]
MRIIAGSARRISLEVVAPATRPFLALARGAIFNSLAGHLPESHVLDLYAGSGSLGLEALSRGASSGVFVENSAATFQALRRNVEKCGFTQVARLVKGDALAEVELLASRIGGPEGLNERFDLVFIDPPFPGFGLTGPAGRRLGVALTELLSPGGQAVLRLEEGEQAPPVWPSFDLGWEKKYGRSHIYRYQKK